MTQPRHALRQENAISHLGHPIVDKPLDMLISGEVIENATVATTQTQWIKMALCYEAYFGISVVCTCDQLGKYPRARARIEMDITGKPLTKLLSK